MFIALEGPDGTGKSTLALALTLRYRAAGYAVMRTSEPWRHERIRPLIAAPDTDPLALLGAFLADREAHLKALVGPALRRGEVVICDRYVYSTLAYQTLAVPPRIVESLCAATLRPDITLVLTCPVDLALQRIAGRGITADRYERKRETQELVAANYVRYARGANTAFIDASGTPSDTLTRAVSALTDWNRQKLCQGALPSIRDSDGNWRYWEP